jgi:hypothetical protein
MLKIIFFVITSLLPLTVLSASADYANFWGVLSEKKYFCQTNESMEIDATKDEIISIKNDVINTIITFEPNKIRNSYNASITSSNLNLSGVPCSLTGGDYFEKGTNMNVPEIAKRGIIHISCASKEINMFFHLPSLSGFLINISQDMENIIGNIKQRNIPLNCNSLN